MVQWNFSNPTFILARNLYQIKVVVELWNWPAYHNWLLNKNNCRLTGYLKEHEFSIIHNSTHRQYKYKEDICVLDYYLKLKSAHKISYDATLSTDIFYHKCNIISLC